MKLVRLAAFTVSIVLSPGAFADSCGPLFAKVDLDLVGDELKAVLKSEKWRARVHAYSLDPAFRAFSDRVLEAVRTLDLERSAQMTFDRPGMYSVTVTVDRAIDAKWTLDFHVDSYTKGYDVAQRDFVEMQLAILNRVFAESDFPRVPEIAVNWRGIRGVKEFFDYPANRLVRDCGRATTAFLGIGAPIIGAGGLVSAFVLDPDAMPHGILTNITAGVLGPAVAAGSVMYAIDCRKRGDTIAFDLKRLVKLRNGVSEAR